jgi:hypothetical protein
MTNFIEEQLAEAMRERVAGIAITTDLVGPTLRVHRRRTVMTRSGYAVGVIGLAGALAVGTLAVNGTGSGATPDRQWAAGTEESPQLRLAAAVAASQGISYRVKSTISPRNQPGSPSMVITGAFDPTRATGYVRIAAGDAPPWHEERLVDGDLYTADLTHLRPIGQGSDQRKPAPSPDERVDWQHDPGKHTSLSYDPKTNLLATSADPQQLLDTLTQSGARISQTGPNTYHFDVALPPRKSFTGRTGTGTMTGDVTVGPDNRIATVVYTVTVRYGTSSTDVLDGTLQLSDYGSPVTVERPAVTTEELPGK